MTPQEIHKALQNVQLNQTVRADKLLRHFYMYGHSSLIGDYQNMFQFSGDRIRFNLVQSCCDTLVNKIAKNAPRPTFLTEDGDWDKQQAAKKREKFVFGQFYKSEVYKKTPKALLQALVYGDGLVKVYSDDTSKQIMVEPVITPTVFVDERKALNGETREWFQVSYVDEDTLKELYPNHAKAIKEAPSEPMPFYLSGTVIGNLKMVIEYWKVPLRMKGDQKDKGEHKIIVGSTQLLSEKWDRPTQPFAKISFIPNLIGFWSKGVAETITPHQLEVNRTLKRISDALRLVASPKVLYEYTSKIVQSHFNNDVGSMIGYTGTRPDFIMPQAVGVELFNHLQYIYQQAYAEIGLSELTAQSKKPDGLDSGKALREYNDIETERFAALGKAWEQFHLDLAEMVLYEAKYLSDKFGKYTVLSPDPKGCEIIDFKDIDMDQDAYVMQCFPTSMLPKTPAGRLAYVQEMMGANLLSPEEGLSLLDFPDTEKITSLKTSELEDILATVDYMLTKDKYLAPEPYQNLNLGVSLMKKSFLKYKNKGCPDDKLDLLVRWINDALQLLAPPQQEPPMTVEDMPPGEPSPENAMPESDIPPAEALTTDPVSEIPQGAM
jgi:hypothetical protein